MKASRTHSAHHELESDFITIVIVIVIVIVSVIVIVIVIVTVTITITIIITIIIIIIIIIIIVIIIIVVILFNASVDYRVWRSEGCLEDWREGQAEAFGQRFQCPSPLLGRQHDS